MISLDEYFYRRATSCDLRTTCTVPKAHYDNVDKLLARVNELLAMFDKARGTHWVAIVSSGYRTAATNATIKGANPKSWHMQGRAVDIADGQRILKRWLLSPQGLVALELCGLYLESDADTPRWCHLQDVATTSRVFNK
jgi:hypothetical protein